MEKESASHNPSVVVNDVTNPSQNSDSSNFYQSSKLESYYKSSGFARKDSTTLLAKVRSRKLLCKQKSRERLDQGRGILERKESFDDVIIFIFAELFKKCI